MSPTEQFDWKVFREDINPSDEDSNLVKYSDVSTLIRSMALGG